MTVDGANVVKVFSREPEFKQLATIAVGANSHGIWPAGDASRACMGLENGDSAAAVSTATNRALGKIKVG